MLSQHLTQQKVASGKLTAANRDNDVAFSEESKLLRTPGYKSENAEAALSDIAFAAPRADLPAPIGAYR